MYYHVHHPTDPWCVSFHNLKSAQRYARISGKPSLLTTSEATSATCKYRVEQVKRATYRLVAKAEPKREPVSYHVHRDSNPWCESWSFDDAERNKRLAIETAKERASKGVTAWVVGPVHERYSTCVWRTSGATVVGYGEAPPPPAGTCTVCDKPMKDHIHPGTTASLPVAPRRRKSPSERPQCPHCKGPQHWNDQGSKINFECLYRQYLVAEGKITDPLSQRLPVAGDADIVLLGLWIGRHPLGTLKYGMMDAGKKTWGVAVKVDPPTAGPIPAVIEDKTAPEPKPEAKPKPAPKEDKEEQKRKKRQELLKAMTRR